jgi:hypothetical protein
MMLVLNYAILGMSAKIGELSKSALLRKELMKSFRKIPPAKSLQKTLIGMPTSMNQGSKSFIDG